jgi:pyruvate-formate lyase-activating enzyme
VDSEWVGFHEVPGILLVRLMSRCNEKCLFCMVADEIVQSRDLDYEAAARRIASQPQGTQIEFFGGEPTIYPRFLDLLRVARASGYPCSIATNMRVFHSEAYTAKVAALDASRIYVRTSIYGHSAELHDYYTDTRGSYRQTVRGIANTVGAGFLTQVNVVILRHNVDRLVDITRQVHGWGVPRIKFGNLISLSTCGDHAVRLSQVRPQLLEAIRVAEDLGLTVTVEKTPTCVVDGRLDLMSTERTIYSSDRVFDDAGACGGCLVRRWCDGVDPDYVARYGFDGIRRLDDVPEAAVRFEPSELADLELLKMCCVRIPETVPDPATVASLAALSARVQERHGDLAVFPDRYVRAQ